jgi:hypothetical protein
MGLTKPTFPDVDPNAFLRKALMEQLALRPRRRAGCACGAVLCVRPEEGRQVFDGDRGLR